MANQTSNISPLTSNSSTALHRLGTVRMEYNTTDGVQKYYMYVQCTANVDASVSQGEVLLWYNSIGTKATPDVSQASQNQPAGIAVNTLTDQYYGWIQIGGYCSAIATNGDDDIADGATLIASSTDGKCDSVAAGTASTYKPVGIATVADVDASDTVAGIIYLSDGVI